MHISRKVTNYLPTFFMAFVLFFSFTASALAQAQYPSQILDLKNWKQTLPTGESERPTEIKADALEDFSDNPFFQVNSTGDGVQFRAPVNGVTTSGSGYPRSELREMSNNGKDTSSWSTTVGFHSMTIEEAITAVPKNKKHVVAGQIHDDKDDVIVIRLEYPKLFIDINGKQGPVLDDKYELGKRFVVRFEAKNGEIRVFYNNSENPVYVMKSKSSGNYFKAGAYTQSNCSKESECSANNYGEVTIYKLAVFHGDSAELNNDRTKNKERGFEIKKELDTQEKEKMEVAKEGTEEKVSFREKLKMFLKGLPFIHIWTLG